MLRTSQSIYMEIQTPKTPNPMFFANRKLNPMRKIHMDRMETTMLNFTSLAARRGFGREKAGAQMTMAAAA